MSPAGGQLPWSWLSWIALCLAHRSTVTVPPREGSPASAAGNAGSPASGLSPPSPLDARTSDTQPHLGSTNPHTSPQAFGCSPSSAHPSSQSLPVHPQVLQGPAQTPPSPASPWSWLPRSRSLPPRQGAHCLCHSPEAKGSLPRLRERTASAPEEDRCGSGTRCLGGWRWEQETSWAAAVVQKQETSRRKSRPGDSGWQDWTAGRVGTPRGREAYWPLPCVRNRRKAPSGPRDWERRGVPGGWFPAAGHMQPS